MRFLTKPVFWVVILILVNLALFIVIFKPSFFKNSPSTFDTKKTVEKKIVKSKSGSCKFLIEEYCKRGVIEEVEVDGNRYKAVGFKLPAEAEITSPFDASVSGGTFVDSRWKGNFVLIDDLKDTSESIMLIGDIEHIRGETWNRTVGETIAAVRGESITNIKDYNLIIIMTKKIGPGDFQDNEKLLNVYFPKLQP